jgi:RHS repeat-associated protein
MTRTGYISVPFDMDFIAHPLTGTGPLSVYFTQTMTTTSFSALLWDFGDGYTSTLTSPVHSYVPGVYTVILSGTSGGVTAGRVKEDYVRVSVPGVVTITYEYDDLYRLVEAGYSSGEWYGYDYDAVGNRLTQEVAGGRVTQYEYDDANRLTGVDSQAYAWDENGNLVWDGVFSYTYDAANRLVEVTNGITAVEYVYNGDGRRVAQVVGGVETRYTLDVAAGLEQVLVEETGGVATTYLYGMGRIAAREGGGAWRYYLHDGLGNVRAETSAAGTLLAVRSFSPFGEPIQGGDGGTPWGYTGEQWDGVASLLFLRARYYSPVPGRFVSKDPFAGYGMRPQTLNRYAYATNNAVNFADPSGLQGDGSVTDKYTDEAFIKMVTEMLFNMPARTERPCDNCTCEEYLGGCECPCGEEDYLASLRNENEIILFAKMLLSETHLSINLKKKTAELDVLVAALTVRNRWESGSSGNTIKEVLLEKNGSQYHGLGIGHVLSSGQIQAICDPKAYFKEDWKWKLVIEMAVRAFLMPIEDDPTGGALFFRDDTKVLPEERYYSDTYYEDTEQWKKEAKPVWKLFEGLERQNKLRGYGIVGIENRAEGG